MSNENKVVQPEPDAALLNQAIELLHALSGDERNRGNCSASEGAAASAYAVQRLAAALLAGVSAPAGDADTTTKEQYRRMFGAACEALGLINEALDLDPEDGGAEPILEAIAELKVKAGARDALTQAELLELRRAADDFDEGCDTDVEHDLLARGALAGYLHCERFVVLDGFALDAAIAAAKGE